ncbi:dephospho-CoA kinase [Geitlerinema sp. PCC 9228]|jgi:dephospho-CoA kinase|uniref:dephospho-CoA kinase n=1 Tax=Geitlerinema sp. PCC 9228 TaxID=111611 RepID=UPI0008F9AEF7|nr:dephospho-CoA kinase [Geitlerinema sp. PCC 9228]
MSEPNLPTQQRRIGLTGGIATGKTTVSDYLAKKYQFPVLDADVYARLAVEKGSPVWQALVERYGNQILWENGTLHRKKLGEIIFADERERRWVEAQIHPYVRSRFVQELSHQVNSVVLVVPLLFEANFTDLATEIWVISCTHDQQIQRLMQRDGLSQEAATSRVSAQMPLSEKKARADVVLENSDTEETLWQQVDRAVERCL